MLVGTRTFWNRSRHRHFGANALPRLLLLLVIPCLAMIGAARSSSAQTITPTDLHDFGLAPDGDGPEGPLARTADGSFIGTTVHGGANQTGCIYKVTISSTGIASEAVLYSFGAALAGLSNTDGLYPTNGIIIGTDGNYYGITPNGGTGAAGTFFELTPAGVFTTLYSFSTAGSASIGNTPAGLVQANDGSFYGVCAYGGTNGSGTLFKLTVSTGTTASASLSTLYSFASPGVMDGNIQTSLPSSLIIGSDGNIYGTTEVGGASNTGSLWTIKTDGTEFTTLHSFSATDTNGINADGADPSGNLLQIADGSFVGCCTFGGDGGSGTVFDITSTGSYSVLHSFSAEIDNGTNTAFINSDGALPYTGLIQPVSGGAVYGTCGFGGTAGLGTIFEISLGTSSSTATFTALYSFGFMAGSVQQASVPFSPLILGADGNLYGTTSEGGANAGASNGGSTTGGIFYQLPLNLPTLTSGVAVTSLSPASIQAGGAAFTLTVNGTGFDKTAIVNWQTATPSSATSLQTTYISATQLTATVPASLIATDTTLNAGTPETHNIVVVNTSTSVTATSSLSIFTVNPPGNAPPVITTATPTSIVAGSTATTLLITGTNLVAGDTVNIGGTVLTPALFTFTQLAVVVPAVLLTAAKTLSVTVSSSGGASNALPLTVTPVTSYAAGLAFISVPYDYPGVALSTIFGYASPKLAVWNTASSVYAVTPNAPADAIRLGRGYWVRFPDAAGVRISGTPATAGTAFTINLAKGWNMIGDPFVTAVSGTGITITTSSTTSYTFSDAAANAIIGGNTYSYEPTTNSYVGDNSGDMQPFVGYWIYADQACSMLVNGS